MSPHTEHSEMLSDPDMVMFLNTGEVPDTLPIKLVIGIISLHCLAVP